MDTLKLWPFVHRIFRLFWVCLLMSLMIVSLARADVGVQPILPGGSNIQPEVETPIQMAAETIEMNVRLATKADNVVVELNPEAYGYETGSAWYPAVAEVEADFTMMNPTTDTISMTTWFPLACALQTFGWQEVSPEEVVPRIEGFTVAVDGTPVEYTVSLLPNPNGDDKPDLPWASFPVTFPAGKETMIHVSYVLPLHRLPKSNALALYYIFQTGAGWDGPIGQAELILNLPYPATPETLAGMPADSLNPPYFVYFGNEVADIPPGGVLEGHQARWAWEDFEPGSDDDFSILLMNPMSWNELEGLRSAVKTHPEDGQAWLKLCTDYYGRSYNWRGVIPLSYSVTYQPLGIEACQEATRLLPGDAAPHYILAGFYLSDLRKNPSRQTLQPVWVELKIAQQLETTQPPSEVVLFDCWDYSSNSECIEVSIENAYSGKPDQAWSSLVWDYITNVADQIARDGTATAEWVTQGAETATEAAKATLTTRPSVTQTPTRKPTLTQTPVPSATPQPPTTETATVATTQVSVSQGFSVAIGLGIVAILIMLIGGAIYLVLRRRF